jgi:pimeloyl-ACP methyl ester carboxylesterase
MDERPLAISTWDGLRMAVREWGGGPATPLLCLPGLVRTGADFADLAARHGGRRRIVAVDYIGRGRSERARNAARYQPELMLRDVLDLCAALHLHRVVVVGTSFGGLLAMGMAAARPSLLAGVVLNDVGPEIGAAGEAFIRAFVATDPALPDLDAAAAHLRQSLPHLSLRGSDQWRRFAGLTYEQAADGRWRPQWDTRIADLLVGGVRNLWPLFHALESTRLLLLHGEISTMLLPDTVAAMRRARPDMAVVTIPGVGHAPTCFEPESAAALDRFLAA